jgi:hypothetical protein
MRVQRKKASATSPPTTHPTCGMHQSTVLNEAVATVKVNPQYHSSKCTHTDEYELGAFAFLLPPPGSLLLSQFMSSCSISAMGTQHAARTNSMVLNETVATAEVNPWCYSSKCRHTDE